MCQRRFAEIHTARCDAIPQGFPYAGLTSTLELLKLLSPSRVFQVHQSKLTECLFPISTRSTREIQKYRDCKFVVHGDRKPNANRTQRDWLESANIDR
jgi:hypothetical protein